MCRGKLLHFDFSISCVDIELRLFVYNFSSIVILHAWMLMSYIILLLQYISSLFTICFLCIFFVNRVIVLTCHRVIMSSYLVLLSHLKWKHAFTLDITQHIGQHTPSGANIWSDKVKCYWRQKIDRQVVRQTDRPTCSKIYTLSFPKKDIHVFTKYVSLVYISLSVASLTLNDTKFISLMVDHVKITFISLSVFVGVSFYHQAYFYHWQLEP